MRLRNRPGARPGSMALVLTLVLVVVLIVLGGDALAHHLDALEAWLSRLGPGGFVLFVAVYVVATSFLIPESILAATAGAVFGFWPGLAATMLAAVLAAALQYGMGKRWLHDFLLRFVAQRPLWQTLRDAMAQDETRLQWLLRLAPFNPATISYLSGAIAVRFGLFLPACCALTPHVALEVYAGHAARHFADASQHAAAHTPYLHGALLVGGFVAVLAILHRFSRIARQAIAAAAQKTGSSQN